MAPIKYVAVAAGLAAAGGVSLAACGGGGSTAAQEPTCTAHTGPNVKCKAPNANYFQDGKKYAQTTLLESESANNLAQNEGVKDWCDDQTANVPLLSLVPGGPFAPQTTQWINGCQAGAKAELNGPAPQGNSSPPPSSSAPSQPSQPNQQQPSQPSAPSTPGPPQQQGPTPGSTLLNQQGTGNFTSGTIANDPNGVSVNWSYDCPADDQSAGELFSVDVAGNGASILKTEGDPLSGSGTTTIPGVSNGAASPVYITAPADCSWSVQITAN